MAGDGEALGDLKFCCQPSMPQARHVCGCAWLCYRSPVSVEIALLQICGQGSCMLYWEQNTSKAELHNECFATPSSRQSSSDCWLWSRHRVWRLLVLEDTRASVLRRCNRSSGSQPLYISTLYIVRDFTIPCWLCHMLGYGLLQAVQTKHCICHKLRYTQRQVLCQDDSHMRSVPCLRPRRRCLGHVPVHPITAAHSKATPLP